MLPTPVAPTVAVTDPTCSADGFADVSNYDADYTYTFTPAGPTVAGGSISGATFGTAYTVTATNLDGCTSVASASFTVEEMFPTPVEPLIGVTPPTCSADGFADISNFNATYTYTFAPAGPTVGVGGSISGATFGQAYTVTATNLDGCTSVSSVSFTVEELIPAPTAPISGGDIAECVLNPIQTITASATAPVGSNVVWYDAAVAGGIVADPSLSAVGQVTYYAESRSIVGDCPSATRTPVTLYIDAYPVLSILPVGFTNDQVFSGGAYTWNLDMDGNVTAQHNATFVYPFTGSHTIVYTDASANAGCSTTETLVIEVKPNQLVGQVKYYNNTESPMPSPFVANYYGMDVPDYFWVTLIEDPDGAANIIELVKVEEYYGENGNPILTNEFYEAAFAFDYNINPAEDYAISVFDGGMEEIDGNGPLGASWTYNNWGGVNATDALLVQHMSVNNDLGKSWIGFPYNPFALENADVNASTSITALDALLTARRGIGLLQRYPNDKPNFVVAGLLLDDAADFNTSNMFGSEIPDIDFTKVSGPYTWASLAEDHLYTSDILSISGENYINVYYTAVGDINASYTPAYGGFKAEPAMDMLYEDELLAQSGQVVTMPIYLDQYASLGAISVDMNYRSDLIEVLAVNYGEDFAYIDSENARLRINWYSLESKAFNTDEPIAKVTVRVLADIATGTELFSLNAGTEMADASAQPIPGLNLKTNALATRDGVASNDVLVADNYPNPFKQSTTISYSLPEAGKVQITLFDMMGAQVETIFEQQAEAGLHTLEFNRNDLKPGVYQYRVILDGESRSHAVVKRMIVIK